MNEYKKLPLIGKTVEVSNYTALGGDVVLADSTNGAFTITLSPASSNVNKPIFVKKISSDKHTKITVAVTGSDMIDGQPTVVLQNQWDSIKVIAGSNAWYVF